MHAAQIDGPRPVDPSERVLSALASAPRTRWDRLVARTGLSDDEVSHAVDALLERGAIELLRASTPALVSLALTPLGAGEFASTERARPDPRAKVLSVLARSPSTRWDRLVEATGLAADEVSDAVDALLAIGAIMLVRAAEPGLVSLALTSRLRAARTTDYASENGPL